MVPNEPPFKAHVSGLPADVPESEMPDRLREAFSEYTITDMSPVTTKGDSRFMFITFATRDDLVAVAGDSPAPILVAGKKIFVQVADRRDPGMLGRSTFPSWDYDTNSEQDVRASRMAANLTGLAVVPYPLIPTGASLMTAKAVNLVALAVHSLQTLVNKEIVSRRNALPAKKPPPELLTGPFAKALFPQSLPTNALIHVLAAVAVLVVFLWILVPTLGVVLPPLLGPRAEKEVLAPLAASSPIALREFPVLPKGTCLGARICVPTPVPPPTNLVRVVKPPHLSLLLVQPLL